MTQLWVATLDGETDTPRWLRFDQYDAFLSVNISLEVATFYLYHRNHRNHFLLCSNQHKNGGLQRTTIPSSSSKT